MHRIALSAAIAASFSPLTEAQELLAPPALAEARGAELTGLLIDAPGDGNLWVLAPGYKARFGRDAVEFIPYYGPHAPRNFPLRFRLRSAERGGAPLALASDAEPRSEAGRIVYERGGLREIWHLRTGEVEQTFELAAGSARGDLRIEVAVESEAPCADVEEGLAFAQPGLGRVIYGDTVTIADGGARWSSPSQWNGEGIELRVPASFADRAARTLVVDPVIRAIAIDSGTDDNSLPDVAFEPTTKNWLVAYMRRFSAFDTDIVSRRYDQSGGILEEVAVAIGSRESASPSVASHGAAAQFLIAWDEDTGIADREIFARTRTASSTAQGTILSLPSTSGVGQVDVQCAVGGSTSTLPGENVYLVVNEVRNSVTSARQRMNQVRVTTSGNVLGAIAGGVPGDAADELAITKHRSAAQRWLVAYRSQGIIKAEAVAVAAAAGSTQIVASGAGDLGHPSPAGDGDDFVVAYHRGITAANRDIFLARMRFSGGALSLLGSNNLTASEPGSLPANDQLDPVLAFDGCRYTCAYREATGSGGNYDLFATVLGFEPGLVFSDVHRPLHDPTPVNLEFHLAIASAGERRGDPGRAFVAWTKNQSSNDGDIAGCLFGSTTNTTGVTTLATACSANPPEVEILNPPALGAVLRIRANRLRQVQQVWLIGLETAPVQLCPERCVLAVFPILATVPGTTVDVPIGCDHFLLGARVAVQNLAIGASGGCRPPSFPIELTVSDTLIVQIQ